MTSQRFNKTIERKKEIIKAAMQLFSEKGYAQTSMRDIARTMGVSLGLCYRYFDSKQILFNTAIDLYIEECCNSYLAILHDSTITIKAKEIYIANPEALISFIIYGQVGLLSKSNIDHHEVAKLLNQYVNQLMKFNP